LHASLGDAAAKYFNFLKIIYDNSAKKYFWGTRWTTCKKIKVCYVVQRPKNSWLSPCLLRFTPHHQLLAQKLLRNFPALPTHHPYGGRTISIDNERN